MTKEQIDILIRDRDIIPESQEPVFIQNIAKDLPTVFCKSKVAIQGKSFTISDNLEEVLNYVCDGYLGLMVSMEHERVKREILGIISNDLNTKYQIKFLEKKIQEQMNIKEKLVLEYLFFQTTDGIKRNWMHKMYLRMEEVIYCLKFRIFEGGKIEGFNVMKNTKNVKLLNQYFLYVDELKEIVKAVTIDENINFLQKRINDLEKLTYPTRQLIEDVNQLSYRQLALYFYYNGFNLKYSYDLPESLKKIGYSKEVPAKSRDKIIADFNLFKSIISGEKNISEKIRTWFKKDLEQLSQLLILEPPIKELIKTHLENL